MDHNAWPYVAGILDGEGSIYVVRGQRSDGCSGERFELGIKISNTDFRLIKWLLHNFGGRFQTDVSNRKGRGFSSLRAKLLYQWKLSGSKNKEKFLLGVIPYMIIKQEQAKLALEWVRLGTGWNQEKRAVLAEKISALNHGHLIEESPTTNTLNTPFYGMKIESELHGDMQSEPRVISVSKTHLTQIMPISVH